MRQLIYIRPDERRIAALMCGYFFLVITSFWILKPLKKALFIGYYAAPGTDFVLAGRSFEAPEVELLAKVANMGVAVVAVTAFSMLAVRLRRQQLSYVFTGFVLVSYGYFAGALADPGELEVWSFYLFGDLFSTLMVATFFAFLNDSVSPEAAKRLYGVVGFGGVAGGAFGSSVVAVWIRSLSLQEWLGIAALAGLAILAVAAGAARAIPDHLRRSRPRASEVATPAESSEPTGGGRRPEPVTPPPGHPALAGMRLVSRSHYLMAIVAIVGLYELVSTVLDFQFTSAVTLFSPDDEARSQAFATVYATTNCLSMIIQLFLTSFVMRRFGLATALLVLPGAIALASTGFVIFPSLWLGGMLSVVDNGLSYSINQSSKEALYVPTSVQEKYQAKAFIDMFVQRFAKALGVGLSLVVVSFFQGIDGLRQLSLLLVPALALWAWAAAYAGSRFHALERSGLEATAFGRTSDDDPAVPLPATPPVATLPPKGRNASPR